MKKSSIALAAAAAGFFVLAAACQQPEKGKGSAKWHLSPAPSPSAGYGAPPIKQKPAGEVSTTAPESGEDFTPEEPDVRPERPHAAAGGYGKEIPTPTVEEKREEQPAAAGYGTNPAAPTWKIEPPPSAAGYGK